MHALLRHIRGLLTAALAGGLGGALVGLTEGTLVTLTSAANDEYWLFLFGAVSYGAVGAGLGLGLALFYQLVRGGRATDGELAAAGAVGALFPLGFAVARYQVNQRLFDEGLTFASGVGAMTYGLLVLLAVLCAIAGALLARGCARRLGVFGVGGALAALLLGAWGVGVATDHTEAAAPVRTVSGAAVGKPNIVLIVVDTLRSDAAQWAEELNGGFKILHRDGVNFERAFSQASWTRPSIATILTSEYPSVHRTEHKMDILPNSADTIAEVLKAQGYWTAAFTTNINVAPIFNFQQGFDEFHYLEPSFYFGATDSATKLAIYKGLRAAREKMSDKIYVANFYQDAETVDEHVEAFLRSKPPEPFFLFVHYMDPHDPYFEHPYNGRGVARVSTPDPPADQAEPLHKLYLDGVRYHDKYLGDLLQRLQDDGLYDNTVIALTADHGEEFHEHGGWWHGTSLYEEQLHVPLIIKRPKESAPGTTRTDLVRSLDIAPTLVAAAGIPAPARFQGIDLFTGTVDEPLLAEEDLEGNRLTSLRDDDWKVITANPDNPRGLPPTALFNLADDPGERTNLAASDTGRAAEMLAQLEQFRARVARGGRPSGAEAAQ
ncbi:MAG: sulfatase [Deltaproteobacteria bacterium]|nr:sulfatase [Deltaproteobacteria bacterium]